MTEPTCGKCGGMMTPQNARQRPELFLHDACLPDELKPAPRWPSECADCGAKVRSDAEAFIHACLHSGDRQWCEHGNPAKLNHLPYTMFPIVARLMEEYKRHV
jgi:hypothetical protein